MVYEMSTSSKKKLEGDIPFVSTRAADCKSSSEAASAVSAGEMLDSEGLVKRIDERGEADRERCRRCAKVERRVVDVVRVL